MGLVLFAYLMEELDLPPPCECECCGCDALSAIVETETGAFHCAECAERMELFGETFCSRFAARN